MSPLTFQQAYEPQTHPDTHLYTAVEASSSFEFAGELVVVAGGGDTRGLVALVVLPPSRKPAVSPENFLSPPLISPTYEART